MNNDYVYSITESAYVTGYVIYEDYTLGQLTWYPFDILDFEWEILPVPSAWGSSEMGHSMDIQSLAGVTDNAGKYIPGSAGEQAMGDLFTSAKKADGTPKYQKISKKAPGETRTPGIDGIYKDTETGQYIFVEAKETSGTGNYAKKLSQKKTGYGWQMDDEWLTHHVENLEI
ncbi:MAG: hypothetical protein AB1798_13805 [Spirochaetota bacterium]